MGMNDRKHYEEIVQQIVKEKSLPLTDDIYIAILAGYTRGFSEAAHKAIARIDKALGKGDRL